MVFAKPFFPDQGHDLLSGQWSLHFASNAYVEAFCHVVNFLDDGWRSRDKEKRTVELLFVKDQENGATFDKCR